LGIAHILVMFDLLQFNDWDGVGDVV